MLSERHNIVVICDEAHRSQYGFKASLPKLQKQMKEARKTSAANEPMVLQAAEPVADYGQLRDVRYGYAQHLRDGLPGATFVAFTGTPVSLEDRDTRAVFGDYVHIYDVEQAVKDGATVPIYYESRLARLALKETETPALDDEVDELAEDEEDDTAKAAQLRRWAALEKLVGGAAAPAEGGRRPGGALREPPGQPGRQGHGGGDEPRDLRAPVRRHRRPAPGLARPGPREGRGQDHHDRLGLGQGAAQARTSTAGTSRSAWSAATRIRPTPSSWSSCATCG